jgi:fatty acid amide hydrolase
LGLGTDMGGSIRVPAAWCGICGLMPTARRLPTTGTFQNFDWLEAITLVPGPMARSVEDLDLAMRVLLTAPQNMNQRQRVDQTFGTPEVRWRDFRDVDLRGLRIGVGSLLCELDYSPAVERGVREAVEVLKAAGATIVEYAGTTVVKHVSLSSDMRCYLGLITADGGACLRAISRGSELDWRASRILWLAGLGRISRTALVMGLRLFGQRTLANMVESGGGVSTQAFGELIRAQRRAHYQALAQFEIQQLDAVLLPPHALPAPQHGKPIDLVAGAESAYYANLLGWPAGVVPVTTVREEEQAGRERSRDVVRRQAAAVDAGSAGLPIGVQVMARPWREDIVLTVMAAIERALPRPQLSAHQLAKIGVVR